MEEAMDILILTGIFFAICSPIIIIVMIKAIARHHTRKAELGTRHLHQDLSQEVVQLREQVSVLVERIQVLEAIVTDNGYHLKEQFKKL